MVGPTVNEGGELHEEAGDRRLFIGRDDLLDVPGWGVSPRPRPTTRLQARRSTFAIHIAEADRSF